MLINLTFELGRWTSTSNISVKGHLVQKLLSGHIDTQTGPVALINMRLRSPVLAALLHGTRAVGVSQTMRHGIQGMELWNFRSSLFLTDGAT